MRAKSVTRHSSRTLVSNENAGGENDSENNDKTVQPVDKLQFNTRVDNFYEGRSNSLKKPWSRSRVLKTIAEIKDAKAAEILKRKRTPSQYHLCRKYDVISTGSEENLITKRKHVNDPIKFILPMDEYYDKLSQIHKDCGHGGRDKMVYALKNKLVIPKAVIEIFVSLCRTCLKKRSQPHKGLVVQPIVSKDLNSRGQVDLMDFQSTPDGQYKWLMNYQNNATKFLHLRPLETKRAAEVAFELLKIFLEFGAPHILQSDNGREFVAEVIDSLASLWPDCKIVNGRPRHPQSQGSVERSNQCVENMLNAWMEDNKSTKWSIGCYFVQFQKNSSFHRIIKRSPYRALFGSDPATGLSSTSMPQILLQKITTEEELKVTLQKEDIDNPAYASKNENGTSNSSTSVPTTSTEPLPLLNICSSCDEEVHEGEIQCAMCVRENIISLERNSMYEYTKIAAEKMLKLSDYKYPPLNIGDSVTVSVLKIDRGPLDARNIEGIIMDCRNGVYSIGTEKGVIKNWLPRSELQHSAATFLKTVPADKQISLREAVACQSLFDGQGFQKCHCRPSKNMCGTRRCACFKNNFKCNSRYHASLTCSNK